MKLNIPNTLVNTLKKLDNGTLDIKTLIIWDDNNTLVYLCGDKWWGRSDSLNLVINNLKELEYTSNSKITKTIKPFNNTRLTEIINSEKELSEHSKIIKLSEIITGNDEISINVVCTK